MRSQHFWQQTGSGAALRWLSGLCWLLAGAGLAGPVLSAQAQSGPIFRVTTYHLSFTGQFGVVTLDQDLVPNYFTIIRGSESGAGTAPNNHVGMYRDPWSTGDLNATLSASNQIEVIRHASAGTWTGTVTVVESLSDHTTDGFRLRDVKWITPPAATSGSGLQTGTTTSGTAWSDIDQVMLLGGREGPGGATDSTSSAQWPVIHFNLYPSSTSTINWERYAGSGYALPGGGWNTISVYVLEWGSNWTVQRRSVTGTASGTAADQTSHYNTSTAISSVVRANTWVWGTGYTHHNGNGNSAQGSIVTLGDGVATNATETRLAVGQQASTTKAFTVYALTHPDLVVHHQFVPNGNSGNTTVDVTMDSTATCNQRMVISYNGMADTSTTNWSRPYFFERYVDPVTVRMTRHSSGTSFAAWVQGIQFCGIQTAASVAGMRAYTGARGLPIIEWETSSEVGTLGYYLRRFDPISGGYERLHPHLLPAISGSPQGGVYRFVDAGARPDAYDYVIEEIAQRGSGRQHGPFQAEPDASAAPVDDPRLRRAGDFAADVRIATARVATARAPSPARAPRSSLRFTLLEDPAERALKVGVEESGWYFLSADSIAAHLNIGIDTVRDWIGMASLRLEHQGQQVPWLPEETGDGLYFLGEATDSPFARDNVYWLRQQPGQHMTSVDLRSGGHGSEPSEYLQYAAFQEDLFADTAVADGPDADYWYWASLTAGHASQDTWSTGFALPGLAVPSGAADAQLRIHLRGASDAIAGPEHHVQVTLNGSLLGETIWDGLTWTSFAVDVDPALLQLEDNQLTLQALRGESVPHSLVYVDRFALEYPRTASVEQDSLWIDADALLGEASTLVVTGLTGPDVYVIDRSDPRQPQRLQVDVEAAETGYLARFDASHADAYLVATPATSLAPRWVEAVVPSQLQDAPHAADYLVIAPRALRTGAQQLADYREADGLRSLVVVLEDVYDAFNHGLPSPHALRAFLRHAHTTWDHAPRYVVLVGGGSYDYRGRLGTQYAGMPPWMQPTSHGLFASDQGYADLDDDGLPDLAMGRLPLDSDEAIEGYLAKLAQFEDQAAGWPAQALLVADRSDSAGNFTRANDDFAQRLPGGLLPERFDLDLSRLSPLRTRLFEHLSDAAGGLLSYVGHGALDRMGAGQGILTSDHLAAGAVAAAPWLVTATSCLINRYETPGFISLGEALVGHATGGAIAVWAPSGMSRHAHASLLSQALLEAVFVTEEARLGDAALDAVVRYGYLHSDLTSYQLLGDPALRLRAAPDSGVTHPPDAGSLPDVPDAGQAGAGGSIPTAVGQAPGIGTSPASGMIPRDGSSGKGRGGGFCSAGAGADGASGQAMLLAWLVLFLVVDARRLRTSRGRREVIHR